EFMKLLSDNGEIAVERGGPVGRVHFWGRVTGERLGELTFNDGLVYKMAFSPDSASLATASHFTDSRRPGGLVQLVDVATRKTMGAPLEFNELVSDLAFGPDGTTLIITDGVHIRADGTSNQAKRAVRTWDLATRKVIRETVETDWGLFSPDRRRK